MFYYRRLPKFEYLAPESVDEVSSLLQQYKGEVRIMAGGTIVLHRMKERIGVRQFIIGLQAVPGLDKISCDTSTGLKIGSMARHQDIADSIDVRKGCPLLSTVCTRLGTPQIRNMGSIGGNVACRFATAETVPALIALGAKVKIIAGKDENNPPQFPPFPEQNRFGTGIKGGEGGFSGEKVALMEDLYRELKDGDFITEIHVPALSANTRTGYTKFAVRERFDYATVAAAVVMNMDGNVCRDIKIGLGGVTLQTMRAKAAEDVMKGQVVMDELIEKAARIAADKGTVGSDLMFSAEYKKKVLKVMVKRAIKEAAGA